jgi:molybdopterin converting factor small subunit
VHVLIELPAPLREYTGGSATVAVDAATVGEALAALTDRFPRLRRHIYDDAGRIRGYVNLYVNEEPVPGTRNDATPLADGDTLIIVPSVAGGMATRASPAERPHGRRRRT